MIEVPGVTGVVGVGCTQLCCTLALGSAAFNVADDKVELEEREVVAIMVPVAVEVVEVAVVAAVTGVTIWLVADVDVDNCTGG